MKPPSIQEALNIIISQMNKEYQMTKSAIIDAVLKEAGIMDIVRNLASKINIKIPTKQEAIAKLKEYVNKNPELVDEALKYYHMNLYNIRSSAAVVETHPKVIMFIVVLLLMLFGYNMAKTTNELKEGLKRVETTQDIEIQKVMPN
jgi:hypothetical protein